MITMQFYRTWFTALAACLVIAFSLWGAGRMLTFILPDSLVKGAYETVFGRGSYRSVSELPSMASANESEEAIGHHYAVVRWIAECHKYTGLSQYPTALRDHLVLYPGQDLSLLEKTREKEAAATTNTDSLFARENQLAALSASTTRQRRYLAIRTTEVYSTLENFAILTIIIGLLTTVVVSVSTANIFSNTSVSTTFRVLAIIFPALGTAFGAVQAFYNPATELGQLSASAQGLKQLQAEIASTIWAVDCSKGEKEDDLSKKLEFWLDRVQKIQSGAPAATGGAASKGQEGGTSAPPATTAQSRVQQAAAGAAPATPIAPVASASGAATQ